ncbi:Vacuolar ATP synthase subunit F, putative [Perkinsus marinus ATCC 50983]|uniref:Vacuolar ATP synthase subunit F, putative n=1 Tax=Perkinsus marinus (strain ATCC 50983 / TXsc) TaxID=423536 RepID=C5KIA6_PERM5|nr:Vacuolar ATP synthase subunit F, putative [Perkinsus marinus ATCC 50983]EER15769.1 Vacuolar ATP synthase subunit F, putative [Perkinsus marinus ATCC 50983]|eukprot:XP_002783973.1 Vacuolar ATP synthase subunit F, putative [Perkinsus marinus ATCC 50983]
MVANKIAKKSDLHVAIIGDEETVSGFCLAGSGMRDGNGITNFLVVDAKTRRNDIEEAFKTFVERPDVAIIPSKESHYNPAQDSIMQRVQMFFGQA